MEHVNGTVLFQADTRPQQQEQEEDRQGQLEQEEQQEQLEAAPQAGAEAAALPPVQASPPLLVKLAQPLAQPPPQLQLSPAGSAAGYWEHQLRSLSLAGGAAGSVAVSPFAAAALAYGAAPGGASAGADLRPSSPGELVTVLPAVAVPHPPLSAHAAYPLPSASSYAAALQHQQYAQHYARQYGQQYAQHQQEQMLLQHQQASLCATAARPFALYTGTSGTFLA
jgi:hypothetical protein